MRRLRCGLGAAALGAAALLGACSGSHEPHRVPLAPDGHAQIASTTDVPALLGVSIDGLRQRLGAPQPLPASLQATETNALFGAASGKLDSVVAFRTGGLLLLANYDAHSRQVRDLLLLGHHEDSLMSRAHLRANADDYLVMPVFYADKSFRLLGLRIIAR
ncbi:MAG: hypothetical protein EOO57_00675 [Hymenobacter sp.]|nr:MAG: hypothetical protein EOO57_00675 [Hymenobacter sp.]